MRVVLVLMLGCAALAGRVALAEEAGPLRVLAAASLTEVVEGLAGRFEGARVATSFGASSALARQIRDGAPADLFVSASPDWIEFLRDAGALAGEPVVIARNRLVCVAPRGGALAGSGVSDPAALLAAIGADGRVGIADKGVPAGEYARSALRSLGLLDAFRTRLVGQRDVRAVLHAVEQGELPAGFVYASDAKQAAVPVLFAFDPATHPPIVYQAALLRGASNPEAASSFLEDLLGDRAQALLLYLGFALP